MENTQEILSSSSTSSSSPSSSSNLLLLLVGHVDEGKTALARCLSTLASTASLDKAPQSKERGMTLDLGFSLLEFNKISSTSSTSTSSIDRITLVDSPGHSSLIKAVIQGASTSDLSLLLLDSRIGKNMSETVNENEIFKTSTIESIALSEILLKKLIIVLNKSDLLPEVEEENIERKEEEDIWWKKISAIVPLESLRKENVEDKKKESNVYSQRYKIIKQTNLALDFLLQDGPFYNSDRVLFSATSVLSAPSPESSADLLSPLLIAIQRNAEKIQKKKQNQEIFQNIEENDEEILENSEKKIDILLDLTSTFAYDHSFSLKGHGIIVTGTLLSGYLFHSECKQYKKLKKNLFFIFPDYQIICRVKSIQSFKHNIEEAREGDRVAVNLVILHGAEGRGGGSSSSSSSSGEGGKGSSGNSGEKSKAEVLTGNNFLKSLERGLACSVALPSSLSLSNSINLILQNIKKLKKLSSIHNFTDFYSQNELKIPIYPTILPLFYYQSVIIKLKKVRFYDLNLHKIKSSTLINFHIGHQSVIGKVLFFIKEKEEKENEEINKKKIENSKKHEKLIDNIVLSPFNLGEDYLYQEEFEESEENFAIVQLASAIYSAHDAPIIGSRLDLNKGDIPCRFAFYAKPIVLLPTLFSSASSSSFTISNSSLLATPPELPQGFGLYTNQSKSLKIVEKICDDYKTKLVYTWPFAITKKKEKDILKEKEREKERERMKENEKDKEKGEKDKKKKKNIFSSSLPATFIGMKIKTKNNSIGHIIDIENGKLKISFSHGCYLNDEEDSLHLPFRSYLFSTVPQEYLHYSKSIEELQGSSANFFSQTLKYLKEEDKISIEDEEIIKNLQKSLSSSKSFPTSPSASIPTSATVSILTSAPSTSITSVRIGVVTNISNDSSGKTIAIIDGLFPHYENPQNKIGDRLVVKKKKEKEKGKKNLNELLEIEGIILNSFGKLGKIKASFSSNLIEINDTVIYIHSN